MLGEGSALRFYSRLAARHIAGKAIVTAASEIPDPVAGTSAAAESQRSGLRTRKRCLLAAVGLILVLLSCLAPHLRIGSTTGLGVGRSASSEKCQLQPRIRRSTNLRLPQSLWNSTDATLPGTRSPEASQEQCPVITPRTGAAAGTTLIGDRKRRRSVSSPPIRPAPGCPTHRVALPRTSIPPIAVKNPVHPGGDPTTALL